MNDKYKYLIIIFLLLILYIIYKIIKKDFFKDKFKNIKEIILILTSISYIYILFSKRAKFIYDMSYMLAILIMLSLTLLYFAYGLIKNKKEIYNKNVNCYIVLYLVLLISITMVIGRVDIHVSLNNLRHFSTQYLIPFRGIYRYLTYNVSLSTKLYNILGNLVMLIPLSFLLMIKDIQYKKIFNQIKIILPIIILIEFLQLLTYTGSFDIDDIILNFGGTVIFVFLITRFNIIDKIKKIFYNDFNLNKYMKYSLFIISTILPIIFVIKTIIKTISLI